MHLKELLHWAMVRRAAADACEERDNAPASRPPAGATTDDIDEAAE